MFKNLEFNWQVCAIVTLISIIIGTIVITYQYVMLHLTVMSTQVQILEILVQLAANN